MAKYCKVYNIMCTCITCDNVECGYSPRTRAEAEIARGVKLDKLGREVSVEIEKDDTIKIPSPVFEEPESAPARRWFRALTQREIALLGASAMLLALVGIVVISTIEPEEAPSVVTRAPQLETVPDVEPPPPGDLVAEVVPTPTPEPTATPEPPAEPGANMRAVAEEQGVDVLDPVPTPDPRMAKIEKETRELKDKGNELVAKKNYVEARDYYRQAIEVNPEFYQGHNNLANTYFDTGEFADAQPIYRDGLRYAPDSTTLLFNMANTSFRQGYYWQAMQEMNRLLNIDDKDAEAHLIAGICAYKLGQYETARQHFDRVIRIDPENYQAYYNLYLSYLKMGQANVAFTYYSEAVRLNPDVRREGRAARENPGG